jgi:hypothetical protein
MLSFQDFTMLKASDKSWGKSVGMVNKKGGLAGLVRLKSSADPTTKPSSAPAKNGSSINGDITPKPAPNGLSLLGSYSSSDSE